LVIEGVVSSCLFFLSYFPFSNTRLPTSAL
jgi:hypothetical protein